ncbi:membrane protein [Lysobacter daejeonensis GH1-9]|uniref:Membrane protein n=1 Tax=Lysobacter daejeonensis GH1-9 TaxID=1385517 RepID=A0A0A0ER00_9GAMM|nr:M1 family aminopeptidase [Lysobacter daejeonensis]KGM52655.1 membrane protein [Lysobacter daejeonensis GH1-9]
MILEFFRFELREQLRSPLLWVLASLFALLAFGAAASDAIQIGGSIGNVHRNAPTVVATLLAAFGLLGMLIIPAFVSGALLRDFELGTADLLFSSPVRRRDFLLGRLGAALLASLVVYLVIAAGIFIAQFMPWIDGARLGPVLLWPYAWSFAVLVLPNLLFTGALIALLAVTTRSLLWVYLGVIGFLVAYGVSGTLLRDLDNVWLATLLEPLGIRALGRTVRYWSAEERNNGLPAFAGYLLVNRAVWLAVTVGMSAAVFALFRTQRADTGRGWRRVAAAPPTAAAPVSPSGGVPPRATPRFSAATTWAQFQHQVRFDTRGVFRSVPMVVMLVFGLANFIPAALNSELLYGTPVYPVTAQVLGTLQGSYSWLLVVIVMFYAGELVWKERSQRIHEVTDAMPVPGWVPLAAKFTTLLAVIVLFQLIGSLAAMVVQLGKGYTALEPVLYLKQLALNSIPFVLMGGMALCLQVLANNKFVGYALLVLVMVLQAVMGYLNLEHNLYTFGAWPNAPYSDMNGYGHFLVGQLAFQGYWMLLLVALLCGAVALWARGTDAGHRARVARQRMRGRLGVAFVLALLSFAAVGGVLYWNTNLRNTYRSSDDELDLQAHYEREYKRYAQVLQPKILAVDVDVDLYPERQSMRVEGRYLVHNPHAQPLREVHVAMQDDSTLSRMDLGPARLLKHDKDVGYRIYRLAQPLQPGERRELRFTVDTHPTGITNGVAQHDVVGNGTFFNNRLLPSFGYQPRFQIDDRNERRKRGLGEPERAAKLEDVAARNAHQLDDDADWLDFKATVCTAPDQTALAPGYLKREFTRNGRRCFRYEMDRPMVNFYAVLSARWQVRKGAYKGIPIEIYYHPQHAYNVDRMIEGVQKSMAYYEANFGPYQHRQVRIIEFPGYESFAQSFANTIPYSENIGFIADLRNKDAIDYVFYVTAHEIAHQWWGHQVVGANVQGATMLVETLAQYSALMVMEHEYGRAHMRTFLKYELDSYLSGRGGETVEEQPLYRVENQQYIHYRKGSLAFYRLREELGEAAVNRALRGYLVERRFGGAPYPTSLDLLRHLRAQARPEQQALITDLFERISFYDNRVQAATARKREDGKYEVTLNLHAGKHYADGKGKERIAPLDDWIEVGVFARAPSGREADQPVLYLQRHRVTRADPVVKVVVDAEPYEAGFDPYNKLIDRVSADNRRRVSLQ